MDNYDYRRDLIECEQMNEYYDMMEYELELERLSDWRLIFRNNLAALFMNSNLELRLVGAPHIDRVFTTKE